MTSDQKLGWISRTIVIVYDFSSKLFLIGATQPACDRFILWDKLTKPITRYRVGHNFASTVDGLAISFNDQANGIQRSKIGKTLALHDFYKSSAPSKHEFSQMASIASDINGIYDDIVKRETSNGDNITSRDKVEPSILSVAFEGFSLDPKAPCIRCQ